MGKVKYDEFQLTKRHKIAYQTLIILFAMVWISGYVKSSYGIWAEPFLESLIIMAVPGIYFAGASIWQGAYLRMNDSPKMILLLFGFVAVVSLLAVSISIFSGTFHIVEDGQLGGDIGFVLIFSLFTMMFVLLVVRRRMDWE